MESFNTKSGKIILQNMITVIQNNKDYLSEVDGLIGDGDHGVNMNKGFTIFEKKIKDEELNLFESFKILANVLLTEIGGSMGPLYGSFFNGMAKGCRNKEEIDSYVILEMLENGRNKVINIGNAKLGDKTLLDALIPAIEAYKAKLEEGKSLIESLELLKVAANKGRDETINLVAKVGRASRLGERSKGFLDAGATSCALLLTSFSDSVQQLLNDKL